MEKILADSCINPRNRRRFKFAYIKGTKAGLPLNPYTGIDEGEKDFAIVPQEDLPFVPFQPIEEFFPKPSEPGKPLIPTSEEIAANYSHDEKITEIVQATRMVRDENGDVYLLANLPETPESASSLICYEEKGD